MLQIGLPATIAAAAALVAMGTEAREAAKPAATRCAATIVRYVPAKHPRLGDKPWVLARPHAAGVIGSLVWYERTLRDARVNRSDGLVLWQTGERIVWHALGESSPATALAAVRLDGRGSFRIALTASRDGPRSTPRFPSPGCWRLTFRSGATEAIVVARVVPRPKAMGCDATPIDDSSLALARPRSAGIAGGWTWRTAEGAALMYTHGVGPGQLNAKVPWWIRRNWGATLRLQGVRLDGTGVFNQEFLSAGDPSSRPAGYQAVFPSIVDVPTAGCWLFRLRTAGIAGVLVVRAVDRS